MIKVTTSGDFRHMEGFLKKQKEHEFLDRLDKYGKMGVEALKSATPRRTGKTAESWYYIVKKYEDTGSFMITWCNSNVNITPHGRANIAVILETGHATRNGAFVQGREYIKPALRPIFEQIARDAFKEVRR